MFSFEPLIKTNYSIVSTFFKYMNSVGELEPGLFDGARAVKPI